MGANLQWNANVLCACVCICGGLKPNCHVYAAEARAAVGWEEAAEQTPSPSVLSLMLFPWHRSMPRQSRRLWNDLLLQAWVWRMDVGLRKSPGQRKKKKKVSLIDKHVIISWCRCSVFTVLPYKSNILQKANFFCVELSPCEDTSDCAFVWFMHF